MNSSRIRSLRAKLRRLEKKSGGGDGSKQFYNSLPIEQIDALAELAWAGIEAGEPLTEDEAVEFLMDFLDCDDRSARLLWRTANSFPPDPDLLRLSDAELMAYIVKTREEIRALEAEV